MSAHSSDSQLSTLETTKVKGQRQVSMPRSPRFREDFDAPFSMALMNVSRTTIATDISFCPSSQNRASFDGDRSLSSSSASANHQTNAQLSPSIPWRDNRFDSRLSRRISVNEKIRQWAKRSMIRVRPNPDSAEDGDAIGRRKRRATKDTNTEDTTTKQHETAGSTRPPQAIITITEVSDTP